MKKFIISIAALMCVAASATAQTLLVVEEKPALTTKKGKHILPQAGDVSLGVSMTPMLNYFGNMFTRDGVNEAPRFMSNGLGIQLKFFTSDRKAMRLGANINFGTDYYHESVQSDADATATVTDVMKNSSTDLDFNFGYEWRRGHSRVQGFYGAELRASYSRAKTSYEYGNEMNATYSTPWSYNFTDETAEQMEVRQMSVTSAPALGIGVFGFVGVEYFIAPKLSLGGEFNLGIAYSNYGKAKNVSQNFDGTSVVNKTTEFEHPYVMDNGFSVTTRTSGDIFLAFYF